MNATNKPSSSITADRRLPSCNTSRTVVSERSIAPPGPVVLSAISPASGEIAFVSTVRNSDKDRPTKTLINVGLDSISEGSPPSASKVTNIEVASISSYFSQHDDDSSDEEKSIKIDTKYQFDEMLDSFLKDPLFQDRAALEYSFMLHAVGIKILYSKEVNDDYYSCNKPKLQKETDKLKSEVSSYLKIACFQTVSDFLRTIFKNGNIKHSVSLEADIQLTCTVLQEQIESQIFDNCIPIIMDKLPQHPDSSELRNICEHVESKLIEQINKARFIFDPEFRPDEIFLPGMSELLLAILTQKGFVKFSRYHKVTSNIKDITKYDFRQFTYLKNTLTALKNLPGLPGLPLTTNVLTYLEKQQQTPLVTAFLKDINNSPSKKFDSTFQFIEPEAYFKIMALFNPEFQKRVAIRYIKDKFINTFVIKLASTLNSRTRSTLGNHHEFSPNGYTSFFSHVRLSNRSQIREMKNYKSLSPAEAKIFYSKENMYRVWSLFSSKALERLTVYPGNQKGGSRKDMVDSAGSYLEISEVLEGHKSYLNKIIPDFVDDSLIAKWINEIICGKNKLTKIDEEYYKMMYDQSVINKLKEKLVGVAYLLFGCEVARNPASIPVHYMMLELIINKKLNFKDALTPTSDNELTYGGRMPMSAKGAIAAGRQLNKDFAQYLPFKYNYPGNHNPNKEGKGISDSEMVLCEKWILSEWLKLKNYQPIPEGANKHAIPDYINAIFTYILKSISDLNIVTD